MPKGFFCYLVMPFGLRNLGATYQRTVYRLFKELLGITMEGYVDDMLVKSKYRNSHPKDLRRCFEIMKKFNLRLNSKKCMFVVKMGKFLRFMMSKRGIEPNSEKVKAITEMKSPCSMKDVQKLIGRLATLS